MRAVLQFLNRTKYFWIVLVGLVLLPFGYVAYEYLDSPLKEHQKGRTKNALSTVVAGIVASHLVEQGEIELDVLRTWFPDTWIAGSVSPAGIDVTLPHWLWGQTQFSATFDENGMLRGEVQKSEFDWQIQQTEVGVYHVKRAWLKFDSTLHLNVRDGLISGTYERAANVNFQIDGSYRRNRLAITISAPISLDVELVGEIR